MFRMVVPWGTLLGWLLCGVVSSGAWAQMPMTKEQKRKRAKLMRQAKCIQRCQDRTYKRYYRCGVNNLECNLRTWMWSQVCYNKCNASWFCKGFRRAVGAKCPTFCLRDAKKKRKRLCRRSSSRKRKRWCVRRFLRWRKRSRHACSRLCKGLFRRCLARMPLKLPPPTRIPKLLH